MHPAQIKAALAVAGYKQVDLAQEFSLEPGTISAIINGRSRSRQVEDRVAEITRLTLVELWPQWYGEAEPKLSADERALVAAYRELTTAKRAELLAEARADYRAKSHGRVIADRGSIASGGDVNIGSKSGRRRK